MECIEGIEGIQGVVMSDGRGSGVSPWLAGIVGLLAYRSGRRRGEQEAGGSPGSGRDPRRGRWGGARDGGDALRRVRLPDGRDALQVEAELFYREDGDDGVWRRVAVEGTAHRAAQKALELTLVEMEASHRAAEDVPVVLMPVGTDREVRAIDVYATGGRIGHLPEYAVLAVGDALRDTHLANGRPCAVLARIAADPAGRLAVEVMMPDTFTPGSPGSARR
jgi:hypothetical protein